MIFSPDDCAAILRGALQRVSHPLRTENGGLYAGQDMDRVGYHPAAPGVRPLYRDHDYLRVSYCATPGKRWHTLYHVGDRYPVRPGPGLPAVCHIEIAGIVFREPPGAAPCWCLRFRLVESGT